MASEDLYYGLHEEAPARFWEQQNLQARSEQFASINPRFLCFLHELMTYVYVSVQQWTSFQYKCRPQRLTINATYCSDKIRPPAGGRLSASMTHSAIGSYSSSLWEMLCPLYAVARFPLSLNAWYL
jgi:hypothetical protein